MINLINSLAKTFLKAVFAGILIGIAGFGYLVHPTIGMVLFAAGLAGVVLYGVPLFTGVAGANKYDDIGIIYLLFVLGGNFLGAFLAGIIAYCSPFDVELTASEIIKSRLNAGPFQVFGLATGCGIIVEMAVNFARNNDSFTKWLPLILGVPLFVMTGMAHCVADWFYFSLADRLSSAEMWSYCFISLITVLGNAFGCNIYRFCLVKSE